MKSQRLFWPRGAATLAAALLAGAAHGASSAAAAPASAPAPTAAPSPAAPAPAPIAWTDAQARAAGVVTQAVQATATAPGAGLVLPGTVVPLPQAVQIVSAPLAGVVQSVAVGVGEPVKAGQTVARLASPQLLEWQRELMQAQSQADLTATRLKREEKLLAEGIVPEARVQDTRAQNRQAQLALAERRQMLRLAGAPGAGGLNAGLALPAPVAGTVLEVLAAPGQRLEAGAPVLRVLRPGLLGIELQATPEQAARLRVGDAMAVDGCRTPARLAAISPQVSASNQTVQARADFTHGEPCLRLNQFVQVRGAGGAAGPVDAPALPRVPLSAVVRQDGRAYVFVRTPRGFVPTEIASGAAAGDQLPVLRGLKGGDVIAVQGLAALKGAWQGLGAPEK